jgi:golgi SNAP receptor complex member 1
MTGEMESLLSRLQAVVDSMSASLAGGSTSAPPALAHTLLRHTEILHDYTQEFRKTRGSVTSARDRADLLGGIGRAERARSAAGGSGVGVGDGGVDALQAERASLSNANSGADAAVAAGQSLKEDLERQRAMFASMVERMETMSEGMPAVSRLIGQIRRKKKRDLYVIGGVVAVLAFVTFRWRVL